MFGPCSPEALSPGSTRKTWSRRTKYRDLSHEKPAKPREAKDTRTMPGPTAVLENPRAGLAILF